MRKFFICCFLAIFCPFVASAYDAEIDGIYYNFNDADKTAEITCRLIMYNELESDYTGNVVIPSKVIYKDITYTVTSIGNRAFDYCPDLTSVFIPNTVTSIKRSAFEFCTNLTSITIPSSVKTIEIGAFGKCTSLKNLFCYADCSFTDDVFLWWIDGDGIVWPDTHWTTSDLSNITLYAKKSLINDYKSAWPGLGEYNSLDDVFILSYYLNGEEYAYYPYKSNDVITPLENPEKVGYTFSGWSNVPSTMPANNVTATGTFTVNKYKLIYMVDGVEYKTCEIEYGSSITPESDPEKEGYFFSGWSEVPSTMPANDVTVKGAFTKGTYILTYMVDDVVYKTVSYVYGVTITPEAEPTKEGYTFSGWKDLPEIMPGENITVVGIFTINKYKLVYTVDGQEYKSVEVEYNSAITLEETPVKEGYTFSGWSDVPDKMPASDVTVTGSFTVNTYKLTYIVDGTEYKSYDVDYGTNITADSEPTIEGYTFSGWSEIPSTMPANDVTVTGSFTVNKYTITYYVDGEVYMTIEVEYGATITPEDEPTKDGYVFSGWSWIPGKMPAEDVTISGTFKQVGYNINDNIYVVDGGYATLAKGNAAGDVVISPTIIINNNAFDVVTIGQYAFSNNTEITSVTIPDGITIIGDNAFYGCSGIGKLAMGKDIWKIGSKAFAYIGTSASARKRASSEPLIIECHAESVPDAQNDSFEGIDMKNVVLKVDDNLVDSYKKVYPWNQFTNIVGFNSPTDIHSIYSGENGDSIFSIDGRKIDKPQKGMNIIRSSQGTRKVMVK